MLDSYRYSTYHSPLSTRTSLSYSVNDEFDHESATHMTANTNLLPHANHMNLGLDIIPTQNNDEDDQEEGDNDIEKEELEDDGNYNNSNYNLNNVQNVNNLNSVHNVKTENENVLESWLNTGSDNFNGTVNIFPPLSATLPLQDKSINNSNNNTTNDDINKIPTPTYSPQNKLSITATNSSSASLISQNDSSPTASTFSALNSTINSKLFKPRRDRSSHNIIEKKYRTNINSKILQLRDAVPALRAADPKNKIDLDELEGLTPASKLNKASILFKATEYIKHLEKKNNSLLNEIKFLKLNNHSYQNQNNNSNYGNINNNISNKHLPMEMLGQFPNQNQFEPQIQQQQYEFQPQNQNQNLHQFQDPMQQDLPPHVMQQIHQQIYLQMQQQQQQQQQQQHQLPPSENQIPQQTQLHARLPPSMQQNPSLVQMQQQIAPQLSTQLPYQDQNQNQNQNSNSMPLAQKIMVGGMTALVGSQLFGNESSDFKGLSILPLHFISPNVISNFIHVIQIFTFFSCVYYFIKPLVTSINKNNKKQKFSDNSFYLNLLSKIVFFNVSDKNNKNINDSEFLFSLKINDLSKIPSSNFQLINLYIKTLFVDENRLANKINYNFNKLTLLKLISIKLPILAYLFNISLQISKLQDSLLDSKNSSNSKIINFFKEDKSILKSDSTFIQFSSILNSIKTFKSTDKTAIKLFDNANYNSIYEYLVNTPINEVNKFELISVIRIVELLRSTMIYYLKILIESKSDENIFELDKNNKHLIERISSIEKFIPSSCIKLIKCCKIFKCLLSSKNNAYLEDSLKMILLNIEQNFEFIDDNDTLLDILNSNDDVLDKVLNLLNSEELNYKNLITDTNRLSLICSIILHYYSVNNFKDGEKLIKYLKNDKFKKFQCANSLSLMNLIANLKTVIAVLQYNKIDDEINKHILEDILCCLRLYVGQKHDLGSSNDSNSVSDKEKQSEIEKHSKSGIDLDVGLETENDNNDDDKYDDILHLHYELKSELSEKLLELTKGLVGYDGI